MYLGSDAIALAPFTDAITYLDEGDWAVMHRSGVEIFDAAGAARHASADQVGRELAARRQGQPPPLHGEGNPRAARRHQPHARQLSRHGCRHASPFPTSASISPKISRVTISACGTAYYAGLVGKYWIERYARLPVEIDIASEFRYREPPLVEGGLALFVSQSGETADTLATLRYCKAGGQRIASIVNVRTSTIARESDAVLPTLAGPEIGVASTKAFTCQLSALACLAIALGPRARRHLSEEKERELVKALIEVPRLISTMLRNEAQYEHLAQIAVEGPRRALSRSRQSTIPIALEGALKLKEISYIHAEGYAAGELKHGPIALIDENVPVIVVAPGGRSVRKDHLQHAGGRRARRPDHPDLRRRRREGGCKIAAHISRPRRTPSPIRSSMRCRCSFSPITRPSSWAPMSTSRATWPSR